MRGPDRTWLLRVRTTTSFLPLFALREVRTRYRRNLVNVGWAIITPVALLAVYGVVLQGTVNPSFRGAPYLSAVWVGLVAWTFFASAVSAAVASLVNDRDLLTKVYFPREALPLGVVTSALVDLGFGVVTIVIVVVAQGIGLSYRVVGCLLPLAVLVVWAAAIGTLLAVGAVFLRDLIHATNMLLRVGFFATPVVYGVAFLPEWLQRWQMLNPVAVAIEGLRDAFVYDQWVDGLRQVSLLVVGVLALGAAVVVTRRSESVLTDVV